MALVDCVVIMQDATNLIGSFFEDVEGVESVGLWMSSVGALIRWLKANSSHEHADHLEQIVVELRQSVAASPPEAYRELEVEALKRIARRLSLIANMPPLVLSPGQREYLHEHLDDAERSVSIAQEIQVVEWIEKGLGVPMDSDLKRRVTSRRVAVKRESLNALLKKLEVRKHSKAFHSGSQPEVPPSNSVAVTHPGNWNVDLPVIYYHGGQSYSLEGQCPVCVADAAHHILQCFLKEKRSMTDRELAQKVTNPSQAISRFIKAHNGMFGGAIRKPTVRGEGFFARVQPALPHSPD